MTATLLETWQTARSLASKDASLKPKLNELLDKESDEIDQTLRTLRKVDRDEAVELSTIAKAVAGRADLELAGQHVQAQLVMLPAMVTLAPGTIAGPCYAPDIPAGLAIEDLLCRTLDLSLGSLRAAPFFVNATAMAELRMHQVRDLSTHLAAMGDYAQLLPAVLEGEPDQPTRCSVFLPMVWSGHPEEDVPKGIAEQRPKPSYLEAKMRIEETLEQQLAKSCGLVASLVVFKPLTYVMALGFLKRAMFFAEVKALNSSCPEGLRGAVIRWKLSGDMLSLTFEGLRQGPQHLQMGFPDEPREALLLLLTQLCTGIGAKGLSEAP